VHSFKCPLTHEKPVSLSLAQFKSLYNHIKSGIKGLKNKEQKEVTSMNVNELKRFIKAVVLGLCISLFVVVFNFGLFYAFEYFRGWRSRDAIYGFYVLSVFEAVFSIWIGFEFAPKRKALVVYEYFFSQFRTTLTHPPRPFLSVALITATIALLLLVIFVVPETLLNML
jgi:hypothetical protein